MNLHVPPAMSSAELPSTPWQASVDTRNTSGIATGCHLAPPRTHEQKGELEHVSEGRHQTYDFQTLLFLEPWRHLTGHLRIELNSSFINRDKIRSKSGVTGPCRIQGTCLRLCGYSVTRHVVTGI